MEWTAIIIKTTPGLVDALTNHLFELGAEGVTESGTTAEPELESYFKSAELSKVLPLLEQYAKSLREIFPNEPAVQITTRPVKDEKWADKYKEFYTAQKLSKTFFLRPAWDTTTSIPENMIPIVMDPGQAFGTGLHPSTRLSILLIERAFGLFADAAKVSCLDVGTGTGILAIVANKLGAQDIHATDIDSDAVFAAKENCILNGCPAIKVSDKPLDKFTQQFDLVISNILLEAHKALAKDYLRILAPGGQLILSGLLGHQKELLQEIMQPLGFELQVQESMQEWAAFLYTVKERR